jgi:hypothetical protein
MSYESDQDYVTSLGPRDHYALLNELRGIKFTLIVALIVLIAALLPWWMIGLDIVLDELGSGGGGGGGD